MKRLVCMLLCCVLLLSMAATLSISVQAASIDSNHGISGWLADASDKCQPQEQQTDISARFELEKADNGRNLFLQADPMKQIWLVAMMGLVFFGIGITVTVLILKRKNK